MTLAPAERAPEAATSRNNRLSESARVLPDRAKDLVGHAAFDEHLEHSQAFVSGRVNSAAWACTNSRTLVGARPASRVKSSVMRS